MEILPINAADLLQGPETAGLRQVHTQLEVSQEPGQALYFPKDNPRIRRPEFLIGLADQAYFALQVAIQPHGVEGGKLVLVPPIPGVTPTLSPVGSVSAHAVGISKDVKKHLGFRIYVIPVAVFVGEDPDNTVQAWAITHNVRLLFSADRLVDRLAGIAREYADQIYAPPTMAEIQEVIGVLNAPGLPPAWRRRWRRRPIQLHARCGPDGPPGDHPACGHGERLHRRGWRRRSKRTRRHQGWQGGGHEHALTDGCSARAASVRIQLREGAIVWSPPVCQRHILYTRRLCGVAAWPGKGKPGPPYG